MKLFWKKTILVDPISAEIVHAHSDGRKSARSRFAKLAIFLSAGIVIFGSLGSAAYFYREYKELVSRQPEKPEVEMIVAEISRFFELPQGETPTLATVTDREKLSGQEFFARAENGDKVLLYEQAKKAILFRPSSGKIVNVAPINLIEDTATPVAPTAVPEHGSESVAGVETSLPADESSEEKPETVPMTPSKIALLNGSSVTGVTYKLEKDILAAFPEKAEVVAKESASRTDYEGILVVDLSGNRGDDASMIADAIQGEVGPLPAGEATPVDGADILVIVGNQKNSVSE